MRPLKKELQPQHPWGTAEVKARPRSAAAANWKVLSARTQCVAPVGAWVESGLDCMEEEENSPFAAAAEIEEQYKERKREKERLLKRFQEEVKHRVNQHVKIKRKQHLQESYEAVLKESSVVIGFSDSALQWTPKKSTCLYRFTPDSAIGSSSNKVISVQYPNSIVDSEEKVLGVQFTEQAKAVRETVQQVRHRLASRKTGSKGGTPQEPLGGVKENEQEPAICEMDPVDGDEADSGALVGYHDLPAELQKQGKEQWNKNPQRTTESQKVNKKIQKGASLVEQSSVNTERAISQIHWSGTETEDSKKQRQIQYLRYKRLFMDIEREQVKEQQRQKECQRRVERIKREKEFCRFAEEQKMQEKSHSEQVKVMDKYPAEEEEKIKEGTSQGKTKTRRKLSEKLEPLNDSKEKKRALEKQLRNKEYSRYVEALRAQMQEKIQMYNIDLPALCFCGPNFWDSHPDSCANNCVFYKNHKAYSQALHSVISSCDIFNSGSSTRLDIHTFATVHSRSKNS